MLRTLRNVSPRLGRAAAARAISGVPLIDVGRFVNGDLADKKAVAEQLDDACTNVGFMSVVNHGVPQDVIDRCWATTREYFDQPTEVKELVTMTDDYHYGYAGFMVEVLSAGKDTEMGEARGHLADLKESFTMGPYNPASGVSPQRWPATPPQFQADVHAYYQALEGLAGNMLDIFAMALHLPQGWFDDKADKHCSALRMLNYPEQQEPPAEGQFRASEHTDYGSMTILRQDQTGGLQVLDKSGTWLFVEPRDDAFVINLGDLMARWTNDRWVSTMHRVVDMPGASQLDRRQSIAFFHNINADQMVECIDSCRKPGDAPKHAPIKAMDLLLEKHRAATGEA